VYYLKDDLGRELTNPISVSRLLPWNLQGDCLEDEIPDHPLVLFGSTGDLMDQASESEEDNGAVMAEDPDDQTFEPNQLEVGPHVGSNPAKRCEKRPVTEPEKVAPGILRDFEIPDTARGK
jgi:hypothetical protein